MTEKSITSERGKTVYWAEKRDSPFTLVFLPGLTAKETSSTAAKRPAGVSKAIVRFFTCSNLSIPATSYTDLGSRRFRSQSPNRFTASTVIVMAIPGTIANHGLLIM